MPSRPSPLSIAHRVALASAAFFGAAVLAIGCSRGADSELEGTAPLGTASSCERTTRYHAVLRDGQPCEPVAALGGRWEATPVFSSAPATVRAMVCAFTWHADGSETPNRAALEALGAKRLVAQCGACEQGASCTEGPSGAPSSPDASSGMRDPGQAGLSPMGSGAQGCNVCVDPCEGCGYIEEDTAYVILPPDLEHHGILELEGIDHNKLYLQFPLTNGVQNYAVELPAHQFQEGFVHVY